MFRTNRNGTKSCTVRLVCRLTSPLYFFKCDVSVRFAPKVRLNYCVDKNHEDFGD
jgi:hypothetical protein